jgi:hypothetical protein
MPIPSSGPGPLTVCNYTSSRSRPWITLQYMELLAGAPVLKFRPWSAPGGCKCDGENPMEVLHPNIQFSWVILITRHITMCSSMGCAHALNAHDQPLDFHHSRHTHVSTEARSQCYPAEYKSTAWPHRHSWLYFLPTILFFFFFFFKGHQFHSSANFPPPLARFQTFQIIHRSIFTPLFSHLYFLSFLSFFFFLQVRIHFNLTWSSSLPSLWFCFYFGLDDPIQYMELFAGAPVLKFRPWSAPGGCKCNGENLMEVLQPNIQLSCVILTTRHITRCSSMGCAHALNAHDQPLDFHHSRHTHGSTEARS